MQEISQTAADLRYDGLIVESHICPDKALSDAAQQLVPDELEHMIRSISWRKDSVEDPEFVKKLSVYRQEIDQIDSEPVRTAEPTHGHLREKSARSNGTTTLPSCKATAGAISWTRCFRRPTKSESQPRIPENRSRSHTYREYQPTEQSDERLTGRRERRCTPDSRPFPNTGPRSKGRRSLFRSIEIEEVCRDVYGEIELRSGNSAAVFRIRTKESAGKTMCLRCFRKGNPHLPAVYRYLSRCGSPLVSPCRYYEQEMCVATLSDARYRYYDVVLSEWVTDAPCNSAWPRPQSIATRTRSNGSPAFSTGCAHDCSKKSGRTATSNPTTS
ncbi:MAG: hypothetical protein L6V35_04040 [Alistipes putredinis]|nr:MAG: hypothetical protein L6V35_04040 [Alistipes putredinis]